MSPKYEPDAAPVEEIIATIKKCPSGALSYIIGNKHFRNYYKATRIVVEKDGPINCQGEITLIDDQDSDAFLGAQVFRHRHVRRRSVPVSSRLLPFEYVLSSKKRSSTTYIACPRIDRR